MATPPHLAPSENLRQYRGKSMAGKPACHRNRLDYPKVPILRRETPALLACQCTAIGNGGNGLENRAFRIAPALRAPWPPVSRGGTRSWGRIELHKNTFGAVIIALAGLALLLSQAEATPRGDLNMSPVPGLVQNAACVKVCNVWAVCWKFGKPRRCCSRFICR